MNTRTTAYRLLILFLLPWITACEETQQEADAYGNFEATEIFISSERPGRLTSFPLQQGQWMKAGDIAGTIDTTTLILQKKQLLSQIEAILSRTQSITPETAVYDRKLENLRREQVRISTLVADSAATPQTLDEIDGQIQIVEQQKEAHLIKLTNANYSINQEVRPLRIQLEMIEDQIKRSILFAPIEGRVLQTYAETSEVVAAGKPLAKMADTRKMILRVYLSGNQLSSINLGDQVTVSVDGSNGLDSKQGQLVWISDKAEFTPKSLQTREDRVDLVYAAKVEVPNPDGSLKIGMPGEVSWE